MAVTVVVVVAVAVAVAVAVVVVVAVAVASLRALLRVVRMAVTVIVAAVVVRAVRWGSRGARRFRGDLPKRLRSDGRRRAGRYRRRYVRRDHRGDERLSARPARRHRRNGGQVGHFEPDSGLRTGLGKRGHCLVSAACAHAPRVSLAASELRVSSETHGVDSRPTGAEASKNIDAV